MIKKLFSITNTWFYSDIQTFLRPLTVFIKGDLIVLLPLIVLILLTGFISLKYMLIMLGSYLVVRYLGEMIYWLLQQFGPHTFRPDDWGFKNLNNNAVYILYQTSATFWIMVGIGIVTAALMFMK